MTTSLSNTAPSSVTSVRQSATAASHESPLGAWARPCRYSNVVSSGAISPALAPASIDMLQTVIRPSIDSDRMAEPRYSMTWPIPPPVPMWPMIARITSLAVTPCGISTVDRHAHPLRPRLRQRLGRQNVLDLAGADAEGQRPERAVGRGVAVAAHDRHARQGAALLGSDDVDDSLPGIAHREVDDAELLGVLAQHLDLSRRDRDRRSAGRCRRSARCGPRSPPSGRAGAPAVPTAAIRRTPAGW